MNPPWLRKVRLRVRLSEASYEVLQHVVLETGHTVEQVLDAALRVARADDIERVVARDTQEIDEWNA